MPPKRAAKVVPSRDSTSWREDQRRMRNRLSQKAVRERKAARVHQLEQQLAVASTGDDSARLTDLLNANCKLRHELLNTRKKLASLAATATELSERIRTVLDGHDGLGQQPDNDLEHNESLDEQPCQWNNGQASCTESPTTIALALSSDPPGEICEANTLPLPGEDMAPDMNIDYTNIVPEPTEGPQQDLEAMLGSDEYPDAVSNVIQNPVLAPKLRIYTGSAFSRHLECIHKLLRLGEHGRNSWSMPRSIDTMVSAFLEHGWPSLKFWMQVTQSIPLASRVLWWQTSNSQEAATQVPPGNSPTMIQLSRPQYPCILDWVPHPGMRDLLILDYESYDVDQVICDMTNAFIVEVEDNTPMFNEPNSGAALPLVGHGYGYNLMELVEWASILGPAGSNGKDEFTVMQMLRSMTSSEHTSIKPIHRFKLDPRFFQKYPALYDPDAESRYWPKEEPVFQGSQLPPPFDIDTVRQYMNAALQAKLSLGTERGRT